MTLRIKITWFTTVYAYIIHVHLSNHAKAAQYSHFTYLCYLLHAKGQQEGQASAARGPSMRPATFRDSGGNSLNARPGKVPLLTDAQEKYLYPRRMKSRDSSVGIGTRLRAGR
jgi:hypothetical protein